MSQPEKPTGAKTMNTLRYVIEVKASIGNIHRVLRGISHIPFRIRKVSRGTISQRQPTR